MQLRVPTKELKDLYGYRRLKEVRMSSNKELTVTRELLEKVRSLKEYAMLGKRGFFQYVSGVLEWPIIHSSLKKQWTHLSSLTKH